MSQLPLLRPYEELGKGVDSKGMLLPKTVLFRQFINDIILRMGVSQVQLDEIFSTANGNANYNYGEFAKCFVTKSADAQYNYEVYELTGDTCLNHGVVLYFSRVLNAVHERKRLSQLKKIADTREALTTWEKRGDTAKIASTKNELSQLREFQPDSRMVDYYNKLKALYVSTKEYADIANRIGFSDFIVKGARDLHEENDEILEDCLEAFFGCFETLFDRYVEMGYSHHFVTNFMTYVMSSRYINYHPDNLYDLITLLKETNDNTKHDVVQRNGVTTPGFKHEISFDTRSGGYIAYYIDEKTNRRTRINEIPPVFMKSKIGEIEMSRRILEYLKRNQSRYPMMKIKMPPTPEELGIEELCP